MRWSMSHRSAGIRQPIPRQVLSRAMTASRMSCGSSSVGEDMSRSRPGPGIGDQSTPSAIGGDLAGDVSRDRNDPGQLTRLVVGAEQRRG